MLLKSCLRSLAIVLCAGILTACAGRTPAEKTVNLGGYSAAFKEGYADGCDSARGLRTIKNGARYADDVDYMMGWNDGNSICRRRK